MSRSKSTSPAKNSAANYESAAKDIEQEKRMVAALKRLSFGHLMNADPDIPAPDAHYSFVVDNQYSDSYDSQSPSSRSSASSISVHDSPEKNQSQADLEFYDSESSFEPQASESDAGELDASPPPDIGYGEETIWVPANIHPEVNPQQFKNHVKTTIDELLERKLSRSKSANRSKRSSLSFSTTGEVDNEPSDSEAMNPTFNADSMNPSLRELTSELQAMSRLAGMDSNDAITLARSLSTSTIGYSDVERLAFDKLGNATYSSPSAEMLDLGDEHSQQLPARSDDQLHASRSPYTQSHSGTGIFPSNQSHGIRRPGEDFALKRSRRLDYRKNPSSSSFGSQLQSGKAGKLAELRQTLNNTLTTDFAGGTKSPQVSNKSPQVSNKSPQMQTKSRSSSGNNSHRNSVQSFNPRNSQILFSYKKSSPKSPVQSSPTSPESISMAHFASKDSPYLTTSSTAAFEQNIHPTKYGQRKLAPKAYGPSSGPPPQSQPTPQHRSHKSSSREREHSRSKADSSHHSSKRKHEIPSKATHRSSSREEMQHRSAPENHYNEQSGRRGSSSRDKGIAKGHQLLYSGDGPYSQTSNQYGQFLPQRDAKYGHGKFDQNSISGSPHLSKTKSAQAVRRIASSDRLPSNEHAHAHGNLKNHQGSSHKYKEYRTREKTRELNQNLDLFRDELNEFKEKLNKSERPNPRHYSASSESTTRNNDSIQEQPDLSFDLTSHDVSYDDSLGIEKEVLSELHNDIDTKPASSIKPFENIQTDQQLADIEASVENKEMVQSRAVSDSQVPNGFYAQKSREKRDGSDGEIKLNEVPIVLESDVIETKKQSNEELVTEHNIDTQVETYNSAKGNEDLPVTEDVEAGPRQTSDETDRAEDNRNISVSSTLPSSSSPRTDALERKKGKKTWLWSKDKSQAKSSTSSSHPSPAPTPSRSVSSPEISNEKRSSTSTKEESVGKENVITKLFKKRRSSSASQDKVPRDSNARQSIISSGDAEQEQASLTRVSSRNSVTSQKLRKNSSEEGGEIEPENNSIETTEERKSSDGSKKSRLKNKIKSMAKIHEEKHKKPSDASGETDLPVEEIVPDEDDSKPKSTLEVQERLKKSIRRTSKANQPIEFTDSAFGFPLPPPSTSTLVMIDYRFPVHVERAIYRLSHLKLANPKRSLREQVLLSNFMYAYLNLVDHTLHLEQQMSSEDYEVDAPAPDENLLGDQDVDTDFEGDGELEGGDFETIKIDLDVNDT